jgi:hypothetical protein
MKRSTWGSTSLGRSEMVQDLPSRRVMIILMIARTERFWVSGTFADVWYVWIPPKVDPARSNTLGSILRRDASTSHLHATRQATPALLNASARRTISIVASRGRILEYTVTQQGEEMNFTGHSTNIRQSKLNQSTSTLHFSQICGCRVIIGTSLVQPQWYHREHHGPK